jgi:hypothetical protein
MRSLILRLLFVPIAAIAAGCSGDINNLPTTPDPVPVTDAFEGTLTVNGGVTHNVFTGATGAVIATLTSLGDNPPAKIGFSLGTLGATGVCTAVLVNDSAVVTSVLSGTVSNLGGQLCARVYDVGALAEPVAYRFTVTHP